MCELYVRMYNHNKYICMCHLSTPIYTSIRSRMAYIHSTMFDIVTFTEH